MIFTKLKSLFLLTGLLTFTTLTNASSPEEKVRELLAKYDRADSPGFSISISHKGKPVFIEGYGMADLEHGVPNKPETVFHIASISKQFAAISSLMLAKEGKLDLHEDIRTYLPYVPDFGVKVTPWHLVHHTSGLRDQWDLFWLGGLGQGIKTQDHIVSMVKRQEALNFTPGSEYSYSNTGYSLLAELVKAVSGKTLREYTTEHIFKPLGMNNTFFYEDVREIVPNKARSYGKNRESDIWERDLLLMSNVGATSLHTTAIDMLKWAENFRNPTVGDKAFIKEISTMDTLNDGSPSNYGFGLAESEWAGHKAIGHTGSDAGFRAVFFYFPESEFAVFIAANTPDAVTLSSTVTDIVKIYLGDKSEATPAAEVPEAVETDSLKLEEFLGHYEDVASDSTIEVKQEGKGLFFGWYPLVIRTDGTADFGDERRARGSYFILERDKNGVVTSMTENQPVSGKKPKTMQRIKTVTPTKDELAEFAGTYRSEEVDATYTFFVEDGALKANMMWFSEPSEFTPTKQDKFTSNWLSLTVERDENGKVTAILASTGRSKNIRFTRQ